jgi:large subunit ribosomal protein L1
MKRGKKYADARAKYRKEDQLSGDKAIELVKDLSFAKFDETVEMAVKLNLKKSQTVRDTLVLPHQFGKEVRILVFAKGEKADEAKEAGAAYVGDEDLIEKIKGGWLDFDVAVATPDMMKDVGKLGPILGRRGLMPNPKTRTVTFDLKETIEELKQGRVEYRSNKTGIVHLAIGKVSMEGEKITENLQSVLSEIQRKKPTDIKGEFIQSIAVCSTMGPGVKVSMENGKRGAE